VLACYNPRRFHFDSSIPSSSSQARLCWHGDDLVHMHKVALSFWWPPPPSTSQKSHIPSNLNIKLKESARNQNVAICTKNTADPKTPCPQEIHSRHLPRPSEATQTWLKLHWRGTPRLVREWRSPVAYRRSSDRLSRHDSTHHLNPIFNSFYPFTHYKNSSTIFLDS
jgi:hypothetical protein